MCRTTVEMRRRRRLVAAIASWAVFLDLPSFAADNASTRARVSVVHVTDYPRDLAQKERAALLRAFAGLGYVEGRNIELTTYDVETALVAEPRNPAQPSPRDRFGPNPYAVFFATDIPRMRPQVVLASGLRVVAAARESGVGTPVVFWRVSDPVGLGFVATLARPGGNLTGFSAATEKLAPKRLELVHEMAPNARDVGLVFIEDFPVPCSPSGGGQGCGRKNWC